MTQKLVCSSLALDHFGKLTTVQVNNDLETNRTSPADRVVQVLQLAIDIWVTVQFLQSPISNWNAHMVHARISNLLEVVLVDKAFPVLRQDVTALISTKSVAESPLVHGSIARIIEHRGGDPRLQHEPTAQVDTTDLVRSISKLGVTFNEGQKLANTHGKPFWPSFSNVFKFLATYAVTWPKAAARDSPSRAFCENEDGILDIPKTWSTPKILGLWNEGERLCQMVWRSPAISKGHVDS